MTAIDETEFVASFAGTVLEAYNLGGEAQLRYSCVAGEAWDKLAGRSRAISHVARAEGRRPLAFDLPVDITYKSSTVYGWPQIVISMYGFNSWGAEVLLGYGRAHFPTTHGERRIRIPLFSPRPVTLLASFMSWLTGKNPELLDPNSLAEGTDTHLLRTTSCGYVDLTMSLITKGFQEMNYDNIPGSQRSVIQTF